MPLSAQTLQRLRVGLATVLVAFLMFAPSAARAEGEDPVLIEKITALNKQALDQYNNLEFEQARKLLKEALDMCSGAGLDKHPIKARTHVHMGVVLIAAKQQELGVKQFRKALEIQSDIQVTKALANPEIIQAFEEATAANAASPTEGATEPAAPQPGGAEPAEGGAGGEGEADQEPAEDFSHVPIAKGKKGKPITIAVKISPNLTGYKKVVLSYRAEGAEEFLSRDMQQSGDKYIGLIPADATEGNVVTYYVEAEAEDESAVASSGSEETPHTVSLSRGDEEDEGEEGEDEASPPYFLGLLGGLGVGYATGAGEVNVLNPVNAGFASSVGQITAEVGYFLAPRFRVSLQFRYQMVSGTTPVNLAKFEMMYPGSVKDPNECGADRLCYGVNSAFAVLARGTWFFGEGTIQPYFSLALGGGEIRHVVTFSSLQGGVCGAGMGGQKCVDTVLAGPIFAGPGGGALINLTPMFALIAEVNSVLGFPKFTFHLDFNAGVAARF